MVGGYAVSAVAEFGEQVQQPLRHRPAECEVAGDFGAGVIGNEQGVGTGRIRWCRTELVTARGVAVVRSAIPRRPGTRAPDFPGARAELEVNEPNLPERECGYPARRLGALSRAVARPASPPASESAGRRQACNACIARPGRAGAAPGDDRVGRRCGPERRSSGFPGREGPAIQARADPRSPRTPHRRRATCSP